MLSAVYIKWQDHSGYNEHTWKDIEKIKNLSPFIVDTVGFIIKETDDYVVVASYMTEDLYTGMGELCILKTDILIRKELQVPKNNTMAYFKKKPKGKSKSKKPLKKKRAKKS